MRKNRRQVQLILKKKHVSKRERFRPIGSLLKALQSLVGLASSYQHLGYSIGYSKYTVYRKESFPSKESDTKAVILELGSTEPYRAKMGFDKSLENYVEGSACL